MLRIEGARKTFHPGTPSEVRALRGVDLVVEDGSFVTVIGTNGSGKSTLQNAVAGTFRLDAGDIRISGARVTKWAEHSRAALVGRVFQNPFTGTAPSMSIAENISLAALRGKGRWLRWALRHSVLDEMKDRVRMLGMGLEDRLENPIGTLSGGQRQALTLLMATWRKPQLLLLDEHTAALDPKSADLIIQLSKRIIERDRLTALMVTHSMQQAAALGDRLVMMHRGRIIHDFAGPEKQRLRANDLTEIFEEVRRLDRLDETAADVLRRNYV